MRFAKSIAGRVLVSWSDNVPMPMASCGGEGRPGSGWLDLNQGRSLSGTWAGRASQLSEIRPFVSLELCLGEGVAATEGPREVFLLLL